MEDRIITKALVTGKKYDTIADIIISKTNFYYKDNIVYVYDKKSRLFVVADRQPLEKIVMEHIKNTTSLIRKEVSSSILLRLDRDKTNQNKKELSKHMVAMKDYILDMKTNEILNDSNYFISKRLKYNYDPHAYNKDVDTMLNRLTCNDRIMRDQLLEIVGYLMSNNNSIQKAFLFLGGGANGKSAFVRMITKILGSKYISNIPLNKLHNPNSLANMINTYCNIYDDLTYNRADNDMFKTLVTGAEVEIKKLYYDRMSTYLQSKMLFTCNQLPKNFDTSEGYYRRWYIVEFKARFTPDDKDYDPYILDKILCDNAIEYLIKLSVEAYKNLIERNKFLETLDQEKIKQDYKLQSDVLYSFLNAQLELIDTGYEMKVLYEEYLHECELLRQIDKLSWNVFIKRVREHPKLEVYISTKNKVKIYKVKIKKEQ